VDGGTARNTAFTVEQQADGKAQVLLRQGDMYVCGTSDESRVFVAFSATSYGQASAKWQLEHVQGTGSAATYHVRSAAKHSDGSDAELYLSMDEHRIPTLSLRKHSFLIWGPVQQ
jgi:hypothetical protein